MRRPAIVGRARSAGSSRVERLDPFALPLRFTLSDGSADERVRLVELHRDRVVLRRALRGIKMAVNLPVSAYLGVAIQMEPATADVEAAAAIVLAHCDPALSLTLYRASDGADIIAEWQSWARVLGMPLLVAEADGRLREAFASIGALRVAAPIRRRRQRGVLKRRRPSLPLRRKPGRRPSTPIVRRGERELIARN